MDYGQNNGFFTAGVGLSPSEANDFEPENNLDEENWQRSLEISAPVDLPTPPSTQDMATGIPNTPTPIYSSGANSTEPKEKLDSLGTPNTLSGSLNSFGQRTSNNIETVPTALQKESSIENTKMGQITTIANALSVAPVANQPSYNPEYIKTTGDRLDKTSIAEIDKSINELTQTGNLNNFYNEIRGEGSMLEANLHNSFNRKLYGVEGEK